MRKQSLPVERFFVALDEMLRAISVWKTERKGGATLDRGLATV